MILIPKSGLRTSLALIAVLSLSACGNDPEKQASMTSVVGLVKSPLSVFGAKKKVAPQPLGLTRDLLNTLDTPVDLLTVESSGGQALIAQVGSNQGVETWGSADEKTFSFRQGILVATRGLGPDLMSATVPAAAQLAKAGSSFTRVQTYLGDEDQPVTMRFDCQVSLIGRESVTIVERNYSATHLRETCTGDRAQFANDYWFQSGGKLRQSRQWIGKNAGYLTIQRLSGA